MRVPCPKCGAVLDVLPSDHGQRMTCYDCGASLGADERGLRILGPGVPQAVPVAQERKVGMSYNHNDSGIMGSLATILLSVGLFLVTLFLFLPLLDSYAVRAGNAPIDYGERREMRLDDKVTREINREKRKLLRSIETELDKIAEEISDLQERERRGNLDQDSRDKLNKLYDKQDEWQRARNLVSVDGFRDTFNKGSGTKEQPFYKKVKKEVKELVTQKREKREEQREGDKWDEKRDQMDEAVSKTELSSQRARYWYTWGMMFGFLFVGAGALLYIMPSQSTTRRVLGTVVIGAQILVIFFYYVILSGNASTSGGYRPAPRYDRSYDRFDPRFERFEP